MIAPGFISDVLALVLLFPPTRALVRGPVMALAARQGGVTVVNRVSRRRWPGDGGRRPGADDVWDVDSWEEQPRPTIRGEIEDGL